MMRILFILPLLMNLSCVDECHNLTTRVGKSYVNESSQSLKLIFMDNFDDKDTIIIANGDTSHHSDYSRISSINYPVNWDDSQLKELRMIFNDDERCLSFSKEFSLDSLDVTDSTSFRVEIEESDCGGGKDTFFAITKYHYQQAGECN